MRLHLVRSLSPLAGVFHRAINVLRWGEHRGGMFVVLRGVGADGVVRERSWHMLAEGDDGPFIPSMAAAAIVRHCLEGRRPANGARAAIAELSLADYDRLFAKRAIFSGFRDAELYDAAVPLYRRLLGDAWAALPPALQAMHDARVDVTVRGEAVVERGGRPLARLIATMFGFPRAGTGVPVSVTFTPRDRVEVWRRVFAGRSFRSVQAEGRGRSARLLVERFGPFRFGLAVVVDAGRLNLVVRNWNVFGLPLPMWLAPNGEAYEFVADGVFHFHVEIGHRAIGLIVRYRGWLAAPTRDDRDALGG